jgi:hypothetical protein
VALALALAVAVAVAPATPRFYLGWGLKSSAKPSDLGVFFRPRRSQTSRFPDQTGTAGLAVPGSGRLIRQHFRAAQGP